MATQSKLPFDIAEVQRYIDSLGEQAAEKRARLGQLAERLVSFKNIMFVCIAVASIVLLAVVLWVVANWPASWSANPPGY